MAHILALKCGALALYPTYFEYIDYCYGFMIADFPWLNGTFSSLIANSSDVIPAPYTIYYVSLSLASTYLLASGGVAFITVIFSLLSSLNDSLQDIC